MDHQITVTGNIQNNITILPNDFIDEHMTKADGEYVKIYLMILRLQGSGTQITPDLLADRLELTRKDILRAINYWKQEGVLTSEEPCGEKPEEAVDVTVPDPQSVNPASDRQIPIKLMRSPVEMKNVTQDEDFERTIFMAETYIGRPFSSTELNSLCYIRDQLAFSSELMDYLIEYCVGRGKKSIRYIEKVAIAWYQDGIATVKMAKERTVSHTRLSFAVMKAFGIQGRNPASSELSYIESWNNLGLSQELIMEACNRTMIATHQASFPYADKILKDWHEADVTSMEDVRALDEIHRNTSRNQAVSQAGPKEKSNAFHNFEQRNYDYDKLESHLRQKTRR